jgi:hypothetical protein
VYLRVGPNGAVTTVAATADHTELRVDRGVANVSLYQPEENSEILVDLAGGQVSLLKDGLYTFNAKTKTFRVLKGEAAAYATVNSDAKPVMVKEDHQVVFDDGRLRSVDAVPYAERADLLQSPNTGDNGGYGFRGEPAYGPFYDGFYGGYPLGFYDGFYGPPFGFYGYPYLGLGFGYYGGFGGFRGGYGGFGGFHGGHGGFGGHH